MVELKRVGGDGRPRLVPYDPSTPPSHIVRPGLTSVSIDNEPGQTGRQLKASHARV